MEIEALVGRYVRLGMELVRSRPTGNSAKPDDYLVTAASQETLIERPVAELLVAEDEIIEPAPFQPSDEQCGEPLVTYANLVLMPTMTDPRRSLQKEVHLHPLTLPKRQRRQTRRPAF